MTDMLAIDSVADILLNAAPWPVFDIGLGQFVPVPLAIEQYPGRLALDDDRTPEP